VKAFESFVLNGKSLKVFAIIVRFHSEDQGKSLLEACLGTNVNGRQSFHHVTVGARLSHYVDSIELRSDFDLQSKLVLSLVN
jgi:hypothetical protein